MEQAATIRQETQVISHQVEIKKSSETLYLWEFTKLKKLSKVENEYKEPISKFQGAAFSIAWVKGLASYYAENIKKLRASYEKEIQSRSSLHDLDKNDIYPIFKSVRVSIAELDFTKCSVEITSDAKVKFCLLFPDDKMLMVTKPVYPTDYELNDKQVFFSFFVNRKLVVSNVSELQELVDRFNDFFSM